MPLQEVLLEQIQDLYDAEKQLTKALPKMAKAASNPELKQAFEQHLEVTQQQVQRIEQVFEMLGEKAKSKPCAAMRGLIEEGREVMSEEEEPEMLDVALIGAGQRVEHYEMAGYGTARAIAEAIGQKDAAKLLKQTAEEEGEADKMLTKIATRLYKEVGAMGRTQEDEEGMRAGGARSRHSSASGGRRSESNTGRSSSGRGSQSSRGTSGRQSGGRQSEARRGGATHRSSGTSGARISGGAQVTTDHEEIREWAESRGAQPACVRGTGKRGDTGMIRLDFPGFSGAQSLQPISWDEWFKSFDDNNLALVYQEKTAGGKPSNFNKIIGRDTAQARAKGNPHASRHSSRKRR